MSPRSLLFCSNRETSQLLSRFLGQLHFEVECCHEIFEAVKRLTSHSHEVIVIDWDEGLEASFLLKTARELKSNRSAFVIALAKPEAVAAVRQAGANEVVTKAQVSEEIKNSLVSSRDFLAGLERRFEASRKPANAAAKVPAIRPLPVAVQPLAAVQPLPMLPKTPPSPPRARAKGTGAPASLTLASAESSLFPKSVSLNTFPARPANFASTLRVNKRRNALLGRTAMVIAFFAVGYVASQPLSWAGSSIAEIYQEAWGIDPTRHQSPRVEVQPTAKMASTPFLEPVERPSHRATAASLTRVQVTPLYNDPLRHETPFRSPGKSLDAESMASPSIVDRVSNGMHIPESLASQFPGGGTVRNVAERISPAILGALEPINLPAYLAEKLLVNKIEPSYPAQALRAGLQGPVVLQAWIGKDGRVRDLKLVRGPLLLGQAAYQAVKQWRYEPYLLNGEAVEAQTYVTLDFKLP